MRTRLQTSSGDPVPRRDGHRSVLLHEAVDSLQLKKDDVVVDATLGGAGHAKEIARSLDKEGTLIGFDLDSDAIARAETALKGASCKVLLIEANFRHMAGQLRERGISHITKALFDLGWSSYQLDSGRGFSIHTQEPLLMTYGKEGAITARTAVNEWAEESLADILFGFGGERYSRRIAKAIVEYRQKRSIETAGELAEIVYQAVPAGYRRGKIHPATRTFQALRIAVNDELGALAEGLSGAFDLLRPGGRIAVITFHSLEDRIVKQLFASLEKEGRGIRVHKKPLTPTVEEIRENRRARSAKLRIFQKNHDEEITQNKQIQTLPSPGEI